METPFDTQLVTLTTKLEQVRSQMEAVAQRFISASVGPVAAWYNNKVEDVAKKDTERTKALGPDGIKAVKESLGSLCDKAPETVKRVLGWNSNWQHRKTEVHREHYALKDDQLVNKYRSDHGHGASALGQAFSIILGDVGNFLSHHGFTESKYEFRAEPGSGLSYQGSMYYSPEMAAHINEYAELFTEFLRIRNEQEKLNKEKDSYEAKHLWDNN
jgi:hypothetical protein